MDITEFLAKLVPTLERYSMSPDKPGFIDSLQEGYEKTILKLFTAPYDPDMKKKMIEAGIPSNLASTLQEDKLFKKIFAAKEKEEIQKEIDLLKKMYRLNFNHARPMQVNAQEGLDMGRMVESSIPTKLVTDDNLIEFLKRKLSESETNIENFTDYGMRVLPREILNGLQLENKQIVLKRENVIKTYELQFSVNFILDFYRETRKVNPHYQLPTYIIYNLTTDQLNLLAEKQPTFFAFPNFSSKYFRSNFEDQFSLLKSQNKWLTFDQKETKRKILNQIYKKIKDINNIALIDYEYQIFTELMIVDLAIDDPDLNRFINYIKMVRQPFPLLNKDQRQSLIRSRNQPYVFHSSELESSKIKIGLLTEDYLRALLRKHEAETLDAKLLKFLDEKMYFEEKARMALKKGEDLGILDKVLTEDEKLRIAQKKYITITEKNKKRFNVEEDVILNVKVKNIKQIKVKVYELNLEKHYLQKFAQIEDTINLSYLQPTYSTIYQTDCSNRYKENIYDIKIQKVKKQRGVYVVDLEGDNISSRAVIRKGAIYCFKKLTLAGVQLKFYNEDGSKIQELELWVRGKKVKVQNSYILPFTEGRDNLNIIAMVGSYAELVNITIPAEDYGLDVFCIYNQETFIVGNKAKVILHPRLSIRSDRQNKEQISLKLLKNIKVKVQIENSLGIKSFLNFENITWTSQEDYVLEFPIQSYVKNVSIFVDAEIKKYTGIIQHLSFRKNIQIDLRQNVPMFVDFYLNKKDDDYVIDVVGKNGEPIPNFNVTLTYLQKAFQQTEQKNLKSDSDGKIHLGPMKLVNSLALTSNSDISNNLKTWSISNPKLQICLLDAMSFKEGETVYIPIPDSSLNLETDVTILRKKKNSYLENWTKNAKVSGNYLEVNKLPEGNYIVNFFSFDHEVKLKIVKGSQWEQSNQVYHHEHEIVFQFNRSTNHYLCLGSAEVKEEENEHKVSVKIEKPEGCNIGEGVKAHVLVSNFVPPSHLDDILPPENNKYRDLKINKFEQKTNHYFSDKTLSEEQSYISNRKNEKQFIGNNMEKPHVFLNRIKVRDTTQKDEVLESGQNYKKRQQELHHDDLEELQEAQLKRYYSQSNEQPLLPNTSINSHNNFLAYGGLTFENIKGDKIQFNLPKNYVNFSIVLMSNNSCIKKKYSIGGKAIKKEIDHLGIKGSGEKLAWTMSREIYQLQKGEKMKINRDSKWCSVSLQNITNFAKLKAIALEDWVLNWNTYEKEKKLETYNKKVCHQLNSYIKHHDPEFFAEVVRPYIKNKIEKTFVDFCLLEREECMQWTENHLIVQLNQFEKALLIEELIRRKENQLADRIASSMILKEKTKKEPFKNFKKQFDTVLNAKMVEEARIPQPIQQRQQRRRSSVKQGFYGMALKSSAIQPQSNLMSLASSGIQMRMAPQMQQFDMGFVQKEEEGELLEMREKFQRPFKAVEKTQEFTQVTYSDVKDKKTSNLIMPSKFWADLAAHLMSNSGKQFVSENFMYLQDKVSFTTAACFLPSQPNANFEIQNEGQNFMISAKSTFLIFVKEIKEVDYQAKFGIMINHRFFDPFDQFDYQDDGIKVEKEVEEFVVHRQYSIQTVVTNTSGTNLEIQLLVDIPQGAIPLMTHEYTQIINTTIPAFSTQSFQRLFYFPKDGEYSFYPSNACWGKTVIAKANEQQKLIVKKQATKKNLKSFTDVIRSGTEEEILAFLREKNIFDKNMFVPAQILWMLKDKKMFDEIIKLMRSRGYYTNEIWQYGFLHDEVKIIQEYLSFVKKKNPTQSPLKIFQYYPYYSTRTHKFLNQNKTTIRNVELKQTYFRFLYDSVVEQSQGSGFKLAFTYYMLLQDRIDQAAKCFRTISQEQKSNYELQADYFECFLNMYEDYPNFTIARKVSAKYLEYPVSAWRDLFKEIADTLKEYDNTTYVESQTAKVEYKTAVFNEGQVIRINVPPKTKVQVLLFPINLELYFSDTPFGQVKSFSAIKPESSVIYEAGQPRQERIKRQKNMKDLIVEVYSTAEGLPSRKVSSFLWTNPAVKVKVNENKGTLQLFCEGKQVSGAYCKVYSSGMKGEKFYRDGYTDITGAFKFALADLKEISQFSILTMTGSGGVISRVMPPSEAGYIAY